MDVRSLHESDLARLRIVEESADQLADYATVPSSFEVARRVYFAGRSMRYRRVDPPYTKVYDDLPRNAPTDWRRRFNIDHWRILVAHLDGVRVGGAAVVIDPREVEPSATEFGDDVAILWDIRVAPAHRRAGVGRRLLAFAEDVVRTAGRHRLTAETQDVNHAACRFYAQLKYKLVGIDRFAHPGLPDEVRLTWTKSLYGARTGGRKQ